MFKGRSTETGFAKISVEIDNVRIAWKWAVAKIKTGQNEAQALDIIQKAVKSLSLFYPMQRFLSGRKRCFQPGCDGAR